MKGKKKLRWDNYVLRQPEDLKILPNSIKARNTRKNIYWSHSAESFNSRMFSLKFINN